MECGVRHRIERFPALGCAQEQAAPLHLALSSGAAGVPGDIGDGDNELGTLALLVLLILASPPPFLEQSLKTRSKKNTLPRGRRYFPSLCLARWEGRPPPATPRCQGSVNLRGSARRAAETWAVLASSRLWDPVGGPEAPSHRLGQRRWG